MGVGQTIFTTKPNQQAVQGFPVNRSYTKAEADNKFALKGAGGSGIASINADSTAAQTLTTGTSGTDFGIVDNGSGDHKFNLPTASAANRGALSPTDYVVFNGKFTLPSLTSGSALFSNGTTIAQDNTNYFYDSTNHNLRIGPTNASITTENRLAVIGNANDYHGTYTQNANSGTLASTDVVVGNDLSTSDPTTYVDFGLNSSGNTNASYTLFGASDAYLFSSGQVNNINIATGTTGKVVKIGVGGLLAANEVARFTSTGMTLGLAGTTLGVLKLSGNTSGTTSLQAAAAASGVLTLPAATDTLVGKATTDTMTNKTLTDAVNNISAPGTTTVGYLGVPQNSRSAAYTTVMADAGKHIYHPSADTTARTFTIDSNANVAYPIGTTLTFINDASAGVITIAITSDTMILAGAGTTGSRTLAASGIATAVKMTSTRWIINGTGLT